MLDPLETLTQINLDDLVGALGSRHRPRLGRLVRLLFRVQARRFARQVLEFDAAAARDGVGAAARSAALVYLRKLRVYGRENVPLGSFVAVANHPGLTDTLVLFAALQRSDLRTIALPRPFLKALPFVAKNLFFLPDAPAGRIGIVRQVGAHLRGGGALLTFPAATSELDPGVYPEAVTSLENWRDSASTFLRMAPEAAVVPVVVSGVLWPVAARGPLGLLRRNPADRQLLLAAFQLVIQLTLGMRLGTAVVQIGSPIETPSADVRGARMVHEAVVGQMRKMMQRAPLAAEGAFA